MAGARRLVFGSYLDELGRIASVQTIAGTGANHLGARFLSETLAQKNVWISDPSWVNHTEVWRVADNSVTRRTYPYYDRQVKSSNFDRMVNTLREP